MASIPTGLFPTSPRPVLGRPPTPTAGPATDGTHGPRGAGELTDVTLTPQPCAGGPPGCWPMRTGVPSVGDGAGGASVGHLCGAGNVTYPWGPRAPSTGRWPLVTVPAHDQHGPGQLSPALSLYILIWKGRPTVLPCRARGIRGQGRRGLGQTWQGPRAPPWWAGRPSEVSCLSALVSPDTRWECPPPTRAKQAPCCGLPVALQGTEDGGPRARGHRCAQGLCHPRLSGRGGPGGTSRAPRAGSEARGLCPRGRLLPARLPPAFGGCRPVAGAALALGRTPGPAGRTDRAAPSGRPGSALAAARPGRPGHCPALASQLQPRFPHCCPGLGLCD